MSQLKCLKAIPVLKKHVDFLVNRVASFSEAQTSAENMEELLSLTWAALMDIAEKSGAHISQVRCLYNSICWFF